MNGACGLNDSHLLMFPDVGSCILVIQENVLFYVKCTLQGWGMNEHYVCNLLSSGSRGDKVLLCGFFNFCLRLKFQLCF